MSGTLKKLLHDACYTALTVTYLPRVLSVHAGLESSELLSVHAGVSLLTVACQSQLHAVKI